MQEHSAHSPLCICLTSPHMGHVQMCLGLLDPVASECMPGEMQVDVLVDRLRTVEAQIAQKERVAGTDLANLKVAVLASCMPHHSAFQIVLSILNLALHIPCLQSLDLIFCFETLAVVTCKSCLVSVAQMSCV